MKLALNWLLPSEWRQAIRSLSNLEVVQAKSVVQVAILDVIRVVTESFGPSASADPAIRRSWSRSECAC